MSSHWCGVEVRRGGASSEIWLWTSPGGKEGQLVTTPRRCSAGCLKYQQCVLEECESDIQYRPIP
ncbi:hypothetical protein TNCV_3440701 [Trichonephila clavipes]|uniref:Uncharacterized protein n=1 Tax=Trichonephila clavipes TaxID=2585209 RepID=A0A8X6W5J9_TRICX|nr:hypothetical protein TNCV_3440701 [Trichonephila clavipes]